MVKLALFGSRRIQSNAEVHHKFRHQCRAPHATMSERYDHNQVGRAKELARLIEHGEGDSRMANILRWKLSRQLFRSS